METEQHGSSPPPTKRLKLDTDLLPPRPTENTIDECPIMSLPIDLLAKIIAGVPIAQRHSLELVDKNFREATLLAWRQLREVRLDEFLIVSKMMDDESTLERDIRSVKSIFEKLANRSPFLTSLHGISMQTEIPELNQSIIISLARFEYLESISFADGIPFTANVEYGYPIQDLNLFLETTRSRSTLRELNIESSNIESSPERQRAMAICIRRFSHLVSNNDRGMREPLKVEKFSADYSMCCWKLNFDLMDVSQLTELHFGSSIIKPEQLTSMINGAANLERLCFAFFHCQNGLYDCGGNGLANNIDLLGAIASREKLKALKIDSSFCFMADDETDHDNCTDFEPEFHDMIKALGRRDIIEELTFAQDFISPRFHMSELIATISEHLPRLRSFIVPVDDCNAHDLKSIVKMEHLEEIEFHYNGDKKKFAEITDGIFAQIGSHKRLKRVSMGGFAREDESPLAELAKLSTLNDVQIRRVDSVRKEDFETWSEGRYVANLDSLTLSGIGVLDKNAEVGLIALIAKATRLRVLCLEGYITDRLLDAIGESCRKLVSLGVSSRSNEISVVGLQRIVDNCSELKDLGGMKNDIRKHLTFPKYWKMRDCVANPWSLHGDDDHDVDYTDGLEQPDW